MSEQGVPLAQMLGALLALGSTDQVCEQVLNTIVQLTQSVRLSVF